MQTFSILFVFLLSALVYSSSFPNEIVNFQNGLSRQHGLAADEQLPAIRLPGDTVPKAYNLTLFPNLQTMQVAGEVIVEVQIKNETHTVTLNAAPNMNISSISLFKRIKKRRNKVRVSFTLDHKKHLLNIAVGPKLKKKKTYTLHISFNYSLSWVPYGFYAGAYTYENTTKAYAVTQFEPYYARMAFPCYDEPGFKTPFTISIARHENEISRSNMPLKSTSKPDPSIGNRTWDTFHTTPPMPTYLVAFMVSKMKSLTELKNKFTTFAREGTINDTRYALGDSPVLMHEMENYMGVNYSLPKMDLVAVPNFAAGAMENWGFVTFKEDILAVDPDVCPTRYSEMATTVIAHEFAHQWFGNIVTPTWWSYLWLNEGFATYFQYFLTSTIKPSWRMDHVFVVDATHSALRMEGYMQSHPLNAEIHELAYIDALFDIITYYKGACIIRMLEHMMTSAVFRKALNRYVIDGHKKGGSVNPSDLCNAIEKQICQDKIKLNLPAPMTITSVMESWTNQAGYPLVTVRRERKTNNVIIEQEPYSDYWNQTKWIIPLTYAKKSSSRFDNTSPMKWLLPGENVIVDKVDKNEWILLNLQQTGYYRVNYDHHNWLLLIRQLEINPQQIHVLNRAQLLDDCLASFLHGKVKLGILGRLIVYLKKETDIIPWFPALRILNYLLYKTADNPTDVYNRLLKKRIYSIMRTQFNRLDFHPKQNDSHPIKMGRVKFLNFACIHNSTECVQSAKKEYKNNENDLTKIHPDLKFVVLCTMLRYTEGDEFERTYKTVNNLYKNATRTCERVIYYFATYCGHGLSQLKSQLLEYFNHDSETSHYEQNAVFEALFSNHYGVDVGLQVMEQVIFDERFRSNRLDHKTEEKLIRMAQLLETKIQSQEQITKLTNLIEKGRRTNGRFSERISAALSTARETWIRLAESRREETMDLFENTD